MNEENNNSKEFSFFERRDGVCKAYPRLRLRWIELRSDAELRIGYPSGTVILKGPKLHTLFRRLANEPITTIKEGVERHGGGDDGVTEMSFRDITT